MTMKGVVLAAGAGTRMWPLATAKPKHILPIGGRPIITQIIKTLASAGINELLIVIGFKGQLIQTELGTGEAFGVTIEYLHQPRWTGTASALGVAREAVGDEPFVAIYGDLLTSRAGVDSVLEKARECPRVIGVARVGNPSDYGVIEITGDRVKRIHEKPSARTVDEAWVNSGIYVLDSSIFQSIKGTSRSRRREFELTTSLQRLVDEGREVKAAMISREDWMDIGKPGDLLEANERVLMNFTPQVKGTVEPGTVIKGPIWLEETAVIKAGCYLEGPAYIGKGSTIGPNSRIRPCTSIGDEVNIGTSCEIKNSIIMDGSKIPHLSYVGDSIVGENCNLGAGTITANIRLDEEPIKSAVKGRLLDSGRRKMGAVMGEGVQTGINASIMPGVKVGPYAFIGPATTVYKDVPANEMIVARQTLVKKRRKRIPERTA